jgi:hypothetical protein
LYSSDEKTNGFVMRSADGRIPALTEGFSRLVVDPANALAADELVTWGNGLWRDIAQADTKPGTVFAQKPTKANFCGVLKFEQAWQAGNSIAPHGLPSYSRGLLVRKGLVGYKTAMKDVNQDANYLAFLRGDRSQNVSTVRTVYSDWVNALKAATDGYKLGIFFDNNSGFPIVSVVNPASPSLTGATFGCFAEVFEKEHKAIFFEINA